ncbi:hypothetical protein BKA60DRAFT_173465 [Fusarium oxysporum]|nr:hypothetical protein BKA60DRAFT_173465 [Fusarium oxysporum]
MSTEDWVTVTRYMEILKPLMLATKKLEGYPRQGRNGLMWEVLPCYEFLLNHLERLMEQYRHDPDEDLKLNIQLGWHLTFTASHQRRQITSGCIVGWGTW